MLWLPELDLQDILAPENTVAVPLALPEVTVYVNRCRHRYNVDRYAGPFGSSPEEHGQRLRRTP